MNAAFYVADESVGTIRPWHDLLRFSAMTNRTNSLLQINLSALRPKSRGLLRVDPERALTPCSEEQGLGSVEGSNSGKAGFVE